MPHSKRPKKLKKNSQLVIRINKSERDEFVELCDELDTSASREIRRFMKEFIDLHQENGGASSPSSDPTAENVSDDTDEDAASRADNDED